MKSSVVLALALPVLICVFGEGHAQDCVVGLPSAEEVRQLGRVAGTLVNTRADQQRIIPDISFTCSGSVTRWIVAGDRLSGGGNSNPPEVQVWRETSSGSRVYTKVHGMLLPPSASETSQIYEFNATSPMDIQPGDILGLFEPFKTWLQMYYTDLYGPVNYYMDTGKDETPPTDDFDISGADGMMYDMPLVTVEITRSDGSSPSECIRNFATIDAVTIGLQQGIQDEQQQQRLVPGISFTCHGFITKWILAAKWADTDRLPELQTWNSPDGINYTKQGNTTVSLEGGSAEMTYYEYCPNPPHEFNDGDVLGMFIPDQTQLALFFERVDSGSFLNYVYDTGNNFSPPGGDLTTTNRDREVNAAPLIAVEVSIMSQPLQSQIPSTAVTVELSTTSPPVPTQTYSSSTTVVLPTPKTTEGDSSPSSSSSAVKESATSLLIPIPTEGDSFSSSSTAAIKESPTSLLIPRPTEGDSFSSSSSSAVKESPTSLLIPRPTEGDSSSSTATIEESPTSRPTEDDISSSSSSDPSGAIAGAVIAVLIVFILAGIVGMAIVVLVIRRRNRKYDLHEQQNTMTNPIYDGTTVDVDKHQEETEEEAVYEEAPEAAIYEDTEPLAYIDPTPTLRALLNHNYLVPTDDERREYESSQDIYASLSDAKEEYNFTESEIYWAPASNQSDLYAQFAQNKFREIPRPLIRVFGHLGTGNFGQVNKGVWESPSGSMEVAVKALRPGADEIDRVKFLQEAAIMGQFHHPNVIALHGVVTVVEPVMIVLELMGRGDLRQYLVYLQPTPGEMVPSNTPEMCLDFCRQIASGMEYLSKKAFVHRDLAARNILVAKDKTCKISDFGMARDLEDEAYYVSHGGKIPVKWTAPEAINYKKYSTATDVWSYGALMYEIWSIGHKPFEGYTNLQTISMVIGGWRLPPPPGCPRAIYELMVSCWHPQAGSRPSFSDLLQSLSRPETELLHWTGEDTKTHPQAAVLGAPLEAGKELYPDLQGGFMKSE